MVASRAQYRSRRSGSQGAETAAGHEGAKAAEPTGELFEDIRTQTAQLTESLGRATRSLTEDAMRNATGVTRAVKDGATEIVSEQKQRAAARVERLGSAIGQAARVLRAGRIDKAADYMEAAAGGVEGTARYLRDSDLSVILDDVADLARQYPMAFLGGMFAVGLGVARFVKAAEPEETAGASHARSRSRGGDRRAGKAKRRAGGSGGAHRGAARQKR